VGKVGESGEEKVGKAPESRALWARKSGLPSLMAGYWHIYEALSYLLFYIFTFSYCFIFGPRSAKDPFSIVSRACLYLPTLFVAAKQ